MAMGVAIVAIVRSPWGKQSGADFNPGPDYKSSEQQSQTTEKLGSDRQPSGYVWQRHTQILQNPGKSIRASRQFREPVLHEAIANQETHREYGPACEVRSLHGILLPYHKSTT